MTWAYFPTKYGLGASFTQDVVEVQVTRWLRDWTETFSHAAYPHIDYGICLFFLQRFHLLVLERSLLLSSLHVIPRHPTWSGPGRRPPSMWQTWCLPPELGDCRWPWGYEADSEQSTGGTLAIPVWVHPGEVHFSQSQCPPPPSYIPSPAVVCWPKWL